MVFPGLGRQNPAFSMTKAGPTSDAKYGGTSVSPLSFWSGGSGGGDDGVLMTLDAEKQFAEQRSECEGDEWDCDGGDAEPDDESVPLPTPELTRESDGVGAG